MSAQTPNPTLSRYSGVLLEISAAEAENLDERGIPKVLGRQYRRTKGAYDKDKRTVTLAVSSSTPVPRSYGLEVLSHEKGDLRTDRLEGGVSLLFNHDYDQLLGRTQSFEVGEPIRVTARFGTSALAREKELDVEAEILVDVSIGYVVNDWVITEDRNGVRTYLAVDWEILEVSLVTVPADPTVGLGRNATDAVVVKVRSFTSALEAAPEPTAPEPAALAVPATPEPAAEAQTLAPPAPPIPADQRTHMEPTNTPATPAAPIPVSVDPAVVEAARVAGLKELRSKYPEQMNERTLEASVGLGVSLSEAKRRIADQIIAAAERNDVPTIADSIFGSMSERERGSYSMRNVYAAAINQRIPGTFKDKGAEAGFEKEVGQTLQKEGEARGLGGFGGGIPVPSPSSRALFALQQRTVTSGGNAGASTNFTVVEPDPIELLRSGTGCLALGARMMTGLQGSFQMPRQTGAASSSWLAESAAVSSTDPTLDAITMSPHRLSIANSYTRDFLAQSRLAVDSFLAQDRLRVLGISFDTVGLAGSGTAPVPLGLLNQSGLAAILAGSLRNISTGAVTAGAGGVPMTFVDWNNLEAAISMANADSLGDISILTTPKIRAAARSTPQIPGTASNLVWPVSKVNADKVQEGPLGYSAKCITNPVLTGFTANSIAGLHAAIMGIWNQMIFGDWGLSEVIADPYTGAATATFKITEHAYYDVNVRHIGAFAVCVSALPS